MSQPTLLAVAHGSRDPAAADVVRALARQVRRLAPVLDVRVAFLGHAAPSLPEELCTAGAGAVIVPLLLSTGYHLKADIADAASSAGARVADPLGPDELLLTALTARLAEAGVPEGIPVVLAAAGSSDPLAARDVQEQAELLAGLRGGPVLAAFASAARPTVAEAVAELRERTGLPVTVASYLLAPGSFQDLLTVSGADWVTAPLGEHPALAGLVIDRYRTAGKAKVAARLAAR
jgi:sirohydrochlorin ferrochelatase